MKKPNIYEPINHSSIESNISSLEEYKNLYEASIHDPESFWSEQAKKLNWFQPWSRVFQGDFSEGNIAWFLDGKLNVSYNCIDRHLPEKADQIALIWEGDEIGEERKISYAQLASEVCRLANVLKTYGVRKGDRVCLYMPMIPELVFAMLACARIGAIHSVIFAGFSAEALRERILDCGAKILITANEGRRGGKAINLKVTVDKALQGLSEVQTVLVVKRTNTEVSMKPGRDIWLAESMKKDRAYCPCEWLDSEDPLFILYTSGSTGKPKGLLHTQAGYLLYAAATFHCIFDYQPGEIHFCAADIGWITGHTYVVYGPLANGATTIMFESTPLYPDPGRYWRVIEKYKANIFYTSPTAIRSIASLGDDFVSAHDLSSLRIIGSVGEPINPEAWLWLYEIVGKEKCSIVDTWWQTETGGILISPIPGIIPMKPGSATLPFFGCQPCLLDDEGQIIRENNRSGYLAMKQLPPGIARSIYGEHDRYLQSYFEQYKGFYFTGDGCYRDEDGFYWITGRVDDVINVAGHRIGTAELESSLAANPLVSEAAIVGIPHEIKGMSIYAFIVLGKAAKIQSKAEIAGILKQQVRTDIGSFAAPDQFQIVQGLPKTRSGKVMRRILKKIAVGQFNDLGNLTTLADPQVVEEIIKGRLAP